MGQNKPPAMGAYSLTWVPSKTPLTLVSYMLYFFLGEMYRVEQLICLHVDFIAELCNGSTYDSGSYCLGSSPSSAAIWPLRLVA